MWTTRLGKQALLPRPAPRRPRCKRVPPAVLRRSRRVAGRFAPGTPVSQQQKALMVQLGIAREGEVIGEEALQAYLKFFEEPLTQEDLSACLALFGWTPEALSFEDDGVEAVAV
uniref:Uncharacterized protein n=1 Tax=Avena sativa TaxID=4498 RepID=A0ACD5VMW9_AVESA